MMRSKIAIYSLGLFVASAFSSASFASQSVAMSIGAQSEGEIIHTEEYHCGQLTKKS
jgi:hypothetical protein